MYVYASKLNIDDGLFCMLLYVATLIMYKQILCIIMYTSAVLTVPGQFEPVSTSTSGGPVTLE